MEGEVGRQHASCQALLVRYPEKMAVLPPFVS
jgi:hypothetical protein